MAATSSSGADVDFDETSTLTDTLPTTDRCVFCGNSLSNGQATVKQTVKGIHGIQKASQRRGDDLQVIVGQTVHKTCRYEYCNINAITRDLKRKRDQHDSEPETPSVSLRSSRPKFDFGTDCLFCGVLAKEDKKKGITVYPVRTFDCQEKLLQTCSERGPNDKWTETVRSRIQYAQDLHAADAVYHHQCNINFRTKKNILLIFRTNDEKIAESSPSPKPGRPVDEERQDAFLHVATYLEENDDEQITLADLCEKMREYLKGVTPYTEKHLRTKLKDHFGDDIIITSIQGKNNVVTFRITAEKILKKFSESEQKKDPHDEKLRIIKTAAKLLLADMKEMMTSKNHYPSSTEISDLNENLSYLPSSLVLFLKTLLHEKKKPDVKIAAIGQALTQAARPKVLLAPLQIGLSVELHHLFGSKYIIELMNRLGFCSSYAEVKRFEQCAALNQGLSLYGTIPDSRIQFVADNVDHNIRTLDGSGTFHGMGIIASATPGTKQHKRIPRDISVSASSMSAVGNITVNYFEPSTIRLSKVYEVLQDFRTREDRRKLDLVWKISWPLRSPRPGWSGMMQTVFDGNFPGQSSITFLPMIDMDPSNLSCVYSTLQFVSALAKDNNIITPVLTFDQPLWWKAMVIIDSEPPNSPLRSIVLRLGGFHTQMSFLACIGRLMAGSGLQQVMEVVFASNAVTHMLSGKSVSRAVRGHFLVDAVLNALISSATFNFPLKIQSSEESVEANAAQHEATLTEKADGVQDPPMHASFKSALSLFDQILQKEVSIDDLEQNPELGRVEEMLRHMKESLRQQRTPRLWLQYMDTVDIIRRFLAAERTGNWQMHLHCLQEMLPYLASAGHNLYTKSIYLYLQEMQQLKQRHPSVYHEFMHGYHVLRRSDRYWAGLSTDLVIEQVLMRSVKSAGGLTRGRGMGDSQRTQWLLSMVFLSTGICW